ncbi:hypothetical protein [Pseudonocardia pini]|uniref:hypothetical protein n=1 Tax=Pseudonocardia pini TaxID=2758030 RepID=UPI0015F0C684|nr:hypothetical protein [Pseudonocardia pini]
MVLLFVVLGAVGPSGAAVLQTRRATGESLTGDPGRVGVPVIEEEDGTRRGGLVGAVATEDRERLFLTVAGPVHEVAVVEGRERTLLV